MKKQHVAATVGALALLANLLVPGLAFGQGSSPQQAQQRVDCPAPGAFSILDTPTDVVFDTVTSSPSTAQNSYDGAVANNTALPAANLLTIDDSRSGLVDGCPELTPGMQVTAEITTTLTDGVDTIPDSAFRIITSNEFAGVAPDCSRPNGEEVCYGTPAGAGNLFDVTAPSLYDDIGREGAIIWDCFRDPDIYTDEAGAGDTTEANECGPTGGAFAPVNTLNGAVVLMSTTTGHDTTMFTNTVVKGTIPAGQQPGTYNGTITYTLSAL